MFVFDVCVCSGEDYTQYSLHNVHQQYDWVMSLAKHPRLLQIVMACLGPDVLLLDSRFICKYPVGNQAESDVGEEQEVRVEAKEEKTGLPYVAWHQDMRFVNATIMTVFTNVYTLVLLICLNSEKYLKHINNILYVFKGIGA